MKKVTVTIGIPAYNEEALIGLLIGNLLRQEEKGFKLDKILVYSDGSSDNTVSISKSFKDKRIKVVNSARRMGKTVRQNQIIGNCKSDILLILDADVLPRDQHFLEKIVSPIVSGKADMVSVPRLPEKPVTFTEKIIFVSVAFKRKIFERYLRNGQNIYTCNGAARAFSKKFYQGFKFPFTYGEDAYSYLYCRSKGYRYYFEKSTGVYYKLPDNWRDHKKQSVRFFRSRIRMERYFGKDLVRQEYKIPIRQTLKVYAQIFRKNPIEIILYSLVVIIMKIDSVFSGQISPLWDISKSSKKNISSGLILQNIKK